MSKASLAVNFDTDWLQQLQGVSKTERIQSRPGSRRKQVPLVPMTAAWHLRVCSSHKANSGRAGERRSTPASLRVVPAPPPEKVPAARPAARAAHSAGKMRQQLRVLAHRSQGKRFLFSLLQQVSSRFHCLCVLKANIFSVFLVWKMIIPQLARRDYVLGEAFPSKLNCHVYSVVI